MRFYGFIRVSSKGQKEKYGPKNQREDMEKFAAIWSDGPHSIVHIEPVVERASAWERIAWQQAIAQGIGSFQVGEVDAFLFPRVDRESRNEFASIPILRHTMDAGVKIYFAQERLYLDPHDPEAVDRYLDEVRDARAYVRKMVKITRPGRIARARDDQKHPTNTRMFGFELVDGRRLVNPAQAAAIREAAQIALKEGRPGPAARWLNSQGFRTVHSKRFSAVTLGGKGGLFRNRALIGETTIQYAGEKEPIIVYHKPILDVDTFQQLQVMLDGRKLRAPRSDVFYALTGIVFCGRCGARFEPTKIGNNRYYRCKRYCGEKHWRKDELEWETNEAFGLYLQHRESQEQYLQLAQQSRAKLENNLAEIEHGIAENSGEWKTLLNKELADYPTIVLTEKKQELTAERESLMRAKAKIEAELATLPQIDPAEVEIAVHELLKPWQLANTGGYGLPYAMSWERASVAAGIWHPDMPQRLSDEQAHLLREMLLKLNCRITIRNHAVFISSRPPLNISAKQAPSTGPCAL